MGKSYSDSKYITQLTNEEVIGELVELEYLDLSKSYKIDPEAVRVIAARGALMAVNWFMGGSGRPSEKLKRGCR